MQSYTYQTQGVCARAISFSLEDGKIYGLQFHGGCPGNTVAISKLLEGTEAKRAIEILKGNQCGARGTSCADQLSIALDEALNGALEAVH